MMSRDTTGAVCPEASPSTKRPSWAVGDPHFWRGRVLHDISWHDAMRLPGITKRMQEDIDCAAEEGWARGVEPATRRFLFKHGIDRVRPL